MTPRRSSCVRTAHCLCVRTGTHECIIMYFTRSTMLLPLLLWRALACLSLVL